MSKKAPRDGPWAQLPLPVRDAWMSLLAAHQHVVRNVDEALVRDAGLTIAEWDALVKLAFCATGEKVCPGDLSQRLSMTPSGVTRMVDRLEGRGLVTRRRGSADARETELGVTKAGLALLAKAAPRHADELRLRFAALTPRECDQMARILQKLAGVESEGTRTEPRESASTVA